MFTAIFPALFV